MENKKNYLAPDLEVMQIQSAAVLSASTSTSGFNDGGLLPSWEE